MIGWWSKLIYRQYSLNKVVTTTICKHIHEWHIHHWNYHRIYLFILQTRHVNSNDVFLILSLLIYIHPFSIIVITFQCKSCINVSVCLKTVCSSNIMAVYIPTVWTSPRTYSMTSVGFSRTQTELSNCLNYHPQLYSLGQNLIQA